MTHLEHRVLQLEKMVKELEALMLKERKEKTNG